MARGIAFGAPEPRAPQCVGCGYLFRPDRPPAEHVPIKRMPDARAAPAVAVTLYGGLCAACADLHAESPAEAAQEGPQDARARVRCTDCQHAAGFPNGRLCPMGKRHANGYRRTCPHFEPAT